MGLRIRSLEALVGDLREARFVVNTGPRSPWSFIGAYFRSFDTPEPHAPLGQFWEAAHSLLTTHVLRWRVRVISWPPDTQVSR